MDKFNPITAEKRSKEKLMCIVYRKNGSGVKKLFFTFLLIVIEVEFFFMA